MLEGEALCGRTYEHSKHLIESDGVIASCSGEVKKETRNERA